MPPSSPSGNEKCLVCNAFAHSFLWGNPRPPLPGRIYAGIHAGDLSSVWCFVPLFVFVTGFEVGPGTLFGVILNEIFPEEVCPDTVR